MGGPSGLPRMKPAGWKYTKAFNPLMEYDERIATLYRDLEIVLGTTDKPNEQLAMRAIQQCPDLINPAASSRWVFFRSKDLLTKKLGSESAAITTMAKDPNLILHPSYDGLSPMLEAMLTPEEVRSARGSGPSGVPIPAIVGGVAAVAIGALWATGGLGGAQ